MAGISKIDAELDVVHYFRQQQFVKVMIDVLFSQRERFLMSKTSKLTLKENQGQEHDSYRMDD